MWLPVQLPATLYTNSLHKKETWDVSYFVPFDAWYQ